jgi:predicted AAA+ superfamily ATPase
LDLQGRYYLYAMIERASIKLLKQYLRAFPAVAILGPRQVGKTTSAKLLTHSLRKHTHYLDLERSSDLQRLSRDAEAYLESFEKECVIIDEIQRKADLFPLLRSLIDQKRVASRFIITGSASPDLLKGASESLAGRIVYLYLHPIGVHELPETITISKHWLRGGFPSALLAKNNQLLHQWLDSFITTYIEKDLPFLFDVRFSPAVMRKLWTMLAHLQGAILNSEKIASSLDVTGTTVKRYLDYLEGAFIIHRLQPFFVNIGKRLVKAPKIYINDSGLLHALLRIETEKELLANPAAGESWEGYVISQIIYAKKPRTDIYYYRTQAGAECDVVLTHGHVVKACIEIKLSKAPVPTKGFYHSMTDLESHQNFMIGSSPQDYLTKDKIRMVDLKTFITKYLPKI